MTFFWLPNGTQPIGHNVIFCSSAKGAPRIAVSLARILMGNRVAARATNDPARMPARIAPIDRIIRRIGVPVDIYPRQGRVPGVGGEEAAELGIVVSRVEILQAGFGIEALVDVTLALGLGEAKGRDGLAEGCIIVGEVGARLPLGRKAHADGAQPVMGLERGQRAHPLHIAMDVRTPQASGVGQNLPFKSPPR